MSNIMDVIKKLCLFFIFYSVNGHSESMVGCDHAMSASEYLHRGHANLSKGNVDLALQDLQCSGEKGYVLSYLLIAAHHMSKGDESDALDSAMRGDPSVEGEYLVIELLNSLAGVKPFLYGDTDKFRSKRPNIEDWLNNDPENYIEASKWLNLILLGETNTSNSAVDSYKRLERLSVCFDFLLADKYKEYLWKSMGDEKRSVVINQNYFKSEQWDCSLSSE